MLRRLHAGAKNPSRDVVHEAARHVRANQRGALPPIYSEPISSRVGFGDVGRFHNCDEGRRNDTDERFKRRTKAEKAANHFPWTDPLKMLSFCVAKLAGVAQWQSASLPS